MLSAAARASEPHANNKRVGLEAEFSKSGEFTLSYSLVRLIFSRAQNTITAGERFGFDL